VNEQELRQAFASNNDEKVFDLLVQPLHEELYKRQTFDFLDDLSWGQQLLLTSDYLHMQVGQGGFIQFIQNGYIALLPGIIEQLMKLGAAELAMVLDDALKVYVLNRELLDAPTSVAEFARLYDEMKEFEAIEARYHQLVNAAIRLMLEYAEMHPSDFWVAA
jgi:hypothetical protein